MTRTTGNLLQVALAAALAASPGCRCDGGPRADVAPEGEERTLMLGVDAPFAELVIPPDSRGDLGAPPARIPLRGWSSGSEEGAKVAVTDLPIRTRNLYFFKPSPGPR